MAGEATLEATAKPSPMEAAEEKPLQTMDEKKKKKKKATSRSQSSNEILTEKDVRERLALNSPELVAELLVHVQGLLATETGRQTRVDAKATSLLTAAGLSLTVAFTFGGLLIAKPNNGSFDPWVTVTFALAVTSGLIAAIHAVAALFVRGDYGSVAGETLFDVETLKAANDMMKDEEATDAPTDKEKREFGVMEYRKYLIPHLWEVFRQRSLVHEKKASRIKWGQGFFIAFLVLLIPVAWFMSQVVAKHQ